MRHPRNAYLLLAGLIGLWLAWDSVDYRLITYSVGADYWEHSAVLTEWLRDLWNPSNPHLADDSSSPRYTPYFMLLTAIGQWTGWNSADLMGLSSVTNYTLIAVGIWLFFNSYFQHRWAAPVGFLVLFFAWGAPAAWAGLFQLRSFFLVGSYPSAFVFGLSLISFWWVQEYLRGEKGDVLSALSLVILAAFMFLCHPLTAAFGVFGCCLLALTQLGVTTRRRVIVIGGLLVGMVVAELWPFYSVWDVVLGTAATGSEDTTWGGTTTLSPSARLKSGAWEHPFYSLPYLIVSGGVLWLALPIATFLVKLPRHRFITLGAGAMLLPYLLKLVIGIPMAHRFLLFAVFFLHMAMVWALLRLLDEVQSAKARNALTPKLKGVAAATAVVAALTISAQLAMLSIEYASLTLGPRLRVVRRATDLPGQRSVFDLYIRLTAGIPEDAVVMAKTALAWPLPATTGKVVSLHHENPMVSDGHRRRQDVSRFFSPKAMDEERGEILRRYDVTHLLLKDDGQPPALEAWLEGRSTTLNVVGPFRMLSLSVP